MTDTGLNYPFPSRTRFNSVEPALLVFKRDGRNMGAHASPDLQLEMGTRADSRVRLLAKALACVLEASGMSASEVNRLRERQGPRLNERKTIALVRRVLA